MARNPLQCVSLVVRGGREWMLGRKPVSWGDTNAAQAQNEAAATGLLGFGSTGEESAKMECNVERGAVGGWFGGREDAGSELVSVAVGDVYFCFRGGLGGGGAFRDDILADSHEVTFKVRGLGVGGEDLGLCG
jgi:hypothetical protein